jgi:hypothetical protein
MRDKHIHPNIHTCTHTNPLAPEDGFEVHPAALHRKPLLEDLADERELLLPLDDALLEGLLVGAEGHRLGHDNVVVEHLRRKEGRGVKEGRKRKA